jgi:PAS domain S-box-containing protein
MQSIDNPAIQHSNPFEKEIIELRQIENFLKDFGFNNREIAIYLALCKTKKASPPEISKLTGIERADTYRILDNLVSKGFAVKIIEKPIKYALAPPEKAFKRDLEVKRRGLSTLENQVEDQNKLILNYIGKKDQDTNQSKFEVIKSRQFVFERLGEMFSVGRCQFEVLYYGTEKSAGRILAYLKDEIMQAPKRKIVFKLMMPITERNLEDVKTLSRYADVKHLEQGSGRIIIVDRKESLLVYNASEDENHSDDLGLWLNNPQFALMQAELFDAQWNLAVDLYSKVKEIEAKTFEKMIPDHQTEKKFSIVFTTNAKGKITYISQNVNPELAKDMQHFINALSNGKTTEFTNAEDNKKTAEVWKRSMKGIAGKEEIRTIQKTGEIRWWSVSWLPIVGKKGKTETIRVAIKDITERKKLETVERELIRSQALLLRSQEIAHLGSWEIDLLTERVYLSDELYRIFGVNPDKKIENFKSLINLVTKGESVYRDICSFVGNNDAKTIEMEKSVSRTDGTPRIVHIKGEIIQDSTGKRIRSVGVIHDITDKKNAEKALIESEARLRLQFEEATDAILLADVETGLIFDCNKAATQLTGYSKEELVGKSQRSIHPNEKVSFNYHLKNPEEQVNKQVLTKSGEIRDVTIKATIIQFKGERMMQGIFRDVTDERKAQETVRQTKQNFETFFDNIDDFLFVLDEQGRMIRVNNTVLRRLEYPQEELLGQSVLMVHPPELREEALKTVQEMIAGTKAFCPIPIMAKTGKLIPVETRVTKGEWDGKPALFGVSKDLSQLKLSEAKFSQAFDANAVLMALSKEQNGEYIDVNKAFLETLGYSRDEVIGKTTKELNIFANSGERDRALAILHETGRARNLDVKIRTKNGAIIDGLFSVDFITIGETATTCILTTMVDVTSKNRKKS